MTIEPVRIAVASCGAFGRKHLEALRRIEAARVVAVVDADADKARAAAQRTGARRRTPRHGGGVVTFCPN